MAVVYILNKDGSPLMPTTRCGHIRLLLKSGKVRVVDTNPFTVQLLYDSPNVVQSLTVGIDPGRTNIGVAVVTDNGTNVFKGELVTRNKDIPKLMTERKAHRQASRSGERKRRQRRAKKCNTVFSEKDVRQRLLPGYNKPIEVHYITNTEARFLNRHKEKLSKTICLDQVEKIISKLQVKPHKPIYKRLDRILPGAMFSTPSGVRVLNGTNGFHNGRVDYYVFENNIKYSPNRCKIIKHNKGILFLNVKINSESCILENLKDR